MNLFAKDHNKAEQGAGLPLSEVPTSGQPSTTPMQTTTRQPVPPSVDEVEDSLDRAGM